MSQLCGMRKNLIVHVNSDIVPSFTDRGLSRRLEMNEGTRSGKSTIRLLGISAERPTNGLYLYLYLTFIQYFG
jgi:hypothetical protein